MKGRFIIMLVLKIITCILTFIGCFIVANDLEYSYSRSRLRLKTLKIGITSSLYIGFCFLLIVTNWNLYTIPKILLFTTICLAIFFMEIDEDITILLFFGVLFITMIAYIVAYTMYQNNITECKTPDVETSSCPILCANDTSSISGDMFGIITYIQGNISEKSEYRYYYELKDGGIKLGSVPAESTTLYYIEDGEEAHIETIVTTTYNLDNNQNPATRCDEKSETTYKLYVPKGSITNTYEFDTN